MRNFGLFFVALVLCVSVLGQQPSTSPAAPVQPNDATGDDISGMYSFLREGEFVQITVEPAGVSGFVSRFGDSDTDKGTFLDQFFEKASLKENHLTFKTKKIHGTWFDFDGTVERGPGKTLQDEAYRLIRGTLIQTSEDAGGKPVAKSRQIEMKSFPQDLDEAEPVKQP